MIIKEDEERKYTTSRKNNFNSKFNLFLFQQSNSKGSKYGDSDSLLFYSFAIFQQDDRRRTRDERGENRFEYYHHHHRQETYKRRDADNTNSHHRHESRGNYSQDRRQHRDRDVIHFFLKEKRIDILI